MSNVSTYPIVLVPFPMTDLVSKKIRPALQLSRQSDNDVIICAISTKRHSSFDIPLTPSETNGLKQLSYIRTNKIATLESRLVLAKLGELDKKAVVLVQAKLKKIFSL